MTVGVSCDSGSASDSVYRRSQWTLQFATERVGALFRAPLRGVERPFFGALDGEESRAPLVQRLVDIFSCETTTTTIIQSGEAPRSLHPTLGS